MKLDTRSAIGLLAGAVVALAAAAGCDSASADCPGGCPAGQTCFYGACVPDQDATDGGFDVAPDVEAEADGGFDAEADATTDGDAETGPDSDGESGIEAEADAPAEAEVDARPDAEAEADDVVYETGCGPELCNALDDDCDGRTDEDFACVAGTTLACTTWCGSTGSAACSDTCLVPGTCTPPDERCDNRIDDDCDGSIDEGCGPAHDTCAAPLDVSAGGTYVGSTVGMTDDSAAPAACASSLAPAPDGFFFFDLAETSDVFVNSSGSAFDTVVYVGSTCGGSELGCNDDMDPPGGPGSTAYLDSGVTLRRLAPGRYYITLDGYAGDSAGDYVLTLYITPADTNGDRCGNPMQLAAGTTTLSGDTCTLSGEASGACGGAGPEGVYWFTVGATRTVSFSTCSASTAFDSVLHLRSDCDDASTQVACNDDDATCASGAGASRFSTSLEPGIYYLFVDGADASACGAYQLAVTGL